MTPIRGGGFIKQGITTVGDINFINVTSVPYHIILSYPIEGGRAEVGAASIVYCITLLQAVTLKLFCESTVIAIDESEKDK